jgi:5'-methylthioadenosine phosphorylase
VDDTHGRGATIGVIGGSGFYSFLEDVEHHHLSTPWGAPSGPVAIGTADTHHGPRRVAFLPRHGPAHEHPPHRINYRANLWALRSVGVTRVLAPCASGSLQPGIHPGDFVVTDQFVDRTYGREQTFFDGPVANHVSVADPYCPELRALAVTAGRDVGITVHDGGTVVVVQGPRFSTRAESRWYRSAGWDVINMTQYPEVALARELGLCYAAIALITDYDTGVEGLEDVEPVTQEAVFRFFDENVERVRTLLFRALEAVPVERGCGCRALSNGVEPVPPPAG